MSGSYLDVANRTKNTFASGIINQAAFASPLFEKLMKSNQVKQEGGNIITALHTYRSPAQGVDVGGGFNPVPRVDRDTTKKIRVEKPMHAFDIVVSKKDMIEARQKNADLGVVDFTKQKLTEAIAFTMIDLESHFITGFTQDGTFTTAQMHNHLTLNGEATSGTLVGTANGLLHAVAPASQTAETMDLTKSLANQHYNQFKDVGTWAGGGREGLREIYMKCARKDVMYKMGPDFCWADDVSFANLIDSSFDKVQTRSVSESGTVEKSRHGTFLDSFGAMEIQAYEHLDLSLYSGDAAGGIFILLNSKYLEINSMLQKLVELDDFAEANRGRQRIAVAEGTLFFNYLLRNLPASGVVTGTAS